MVRTLRALLAVLVLTSTAVAQEKKRVAVLDFDYGTVRSAVQAYFGTDQDVGKGISLLLEQKLVQDGKYSVVDRNTMEKILKEQNFSNSDRVDPATAAKIGHILGVTDSAELDKLQDELDQLSSRARAVKDSVENLRRQQNAQGLNLRGDMAAAEDRMGSDLDKAQAALQNQNAKDARRYMEKAEADLETLEKFMGRR